MTILLAGGSGFLGRALGAHFAAGGHTVRVLTRRARPRHAHEVAWTPDGTTGPWARAVDETDVVINLAGEGIADKRWSAARKQALRSSRLLPARSLARALSDAAPRQRRLIAASAVGYYGAHGDEVVTEATPPGNDFLARLCVEWEQEAAAAATPLTHVALVRTGIVLHPDGGALKTMLLPFRFGLGGPMGSGRQFMPWIHLDDWVRLIGWLATRPTALEAEAVAPNDADDLASLTPGAPTPGRTRASATIAAATDDATGRDVAAWNATAPVPVTNADFARTLGRVLRRPAVMPVPGIALRILLGEFSTFLLTGARVVPAAAEAAGFTFGFRELEPALNELVGRARVR